MTQNYSFLFTADVHGNRGQYTAALERAKSLGLNAVIFGGDISPKEGNKEDGSHWQLGHKTRHPQAQKEFYEGWMIRLFADFTAATGIEIYTMMGNDDFRVNMPILEQAEREGKLKLLHEKAYQLPNGLSVVGESYVDLTPFANKDWELPDTINPNEIPISTRKRISLSGYSSVSDGFEGFFVPEGDFFKVDYDKFPTSRSLENRLARFVKPLSIPSRTIYAIHAPPYGTNVDQMVNLHAGSAAVRKFLEENDAVLGLHGHIHETVDVSGDFKDIVGKTPVAAPGNDPFDHPTNYYTNYSKTLHAVIVEIIGTNVRLRRETLVAA